MRPLRNYKLPSLYCPDHVISTPRSYFESLSTSGPGPTERRYAKVTPKAHLRLVEEIRGWTPTRCCYAKDTYFSD